MWDTWGWLGHEDGALMNKISALIKEAQENSLLHHVRSQLQGAICKLGGGLPPDAESAGTLILDFHPPEL